MHPKRYYGSRTGRGLETPDYSVFHVQSGLSGRQALCSRSTVPCCAPSQALIARLGSRSLTSMPLLQCHVQSGLSGRQPLWRRNTVPCCAPSQALIARLGSRSLTIICSAAGTPLKVVADTLFDDAEM